MPTILPSLKSTAGSWDEDTPRTYLADPKAAVPSTRMSFAGLKKEGDIENILDYLEAATQQLLPFVGGLKQGRRRKLPAILVGSKNASGPAWRDSAMAIGGLFWIAAAATSTRCLSSADSEPDGPRNLT